MYHVQLIRGEKMRKIIIMVLVLILVLVVGCSNREDVSQNIVEVKTEAKIEVVDTDEEVLPEQKETNDTAEDIQRPIISVENFSNGERIGDIFNEGECVQAKNMVYDNLKSAFDIYGFINPITPILTEYAIEERMDPYGLFYVFIIQLNDEDINIDDNSFESIWGALSFYEMSFEMIDGVKIVIADEDGAINRMVIMTKE